MLLDDIRCLLLGSGSGSGGSRLGSLGNFTGGGGNLMRKEGPVAGGGGGRGRRRHEAGGGTSGRGGKVGRRIGAEDRSFVRSTAGESGESEQEGCSHDRGGCFERAWEEHGGGDDEDDEGGKGEERATPRAKPRHAGGENNKDEKKKRKNTETPPPPRQVKKSKTAAGINGQKPKTPPGRQASVVSDRPHQNKTTVLTWLGPGTTEAGGERRAREVWLRRRKRKASKLSYTACIPLWGSWNASLSLTSVPAQLRACGCAYLLPALHVRTWVREGI